MLGSCIVYIELNLLNFRPYPFVAGPILQTETAAVCHTHTTSLTQPEETKSNSWLQKKPNKLFQFALVWWLLRPKCWNYEHSRLHHFQEAGVVAFPSGQVLGPENHHSHPFVSQYFLFFWTMIIKYFSFLFTNLQFIISYIYIYINIFFKFI